MTQPSQHKTFPQVKNQDAEILRVFIGYDDRQPISYSVLQHSIVSHASKPVQITPLILEQLPITRRGLTPFTFSRFMVPWLCGYKGWGLFMDADMIVRDDIKQLFDLADPEFDLMVIKNKLRFEWASVMLFNCETCTDLTPQSVEQMETGDLFGMKWAANIGDLPSEWNHLVGYDRPREDASLVHYTQGIPAFDETRGCEFSEEWKHAFDAMMYFGSWEEIMGTSVHAAEIDGKKVSKLKAREILQQRAQQAAANLEACPFSRENPSPSYLAHVKLYQELHQQGTDEDKAEDTFNGSTLTYFADKINQYFSGFEIDTVLDYGSGKGAQYGYMTIKQDNGGVFHSIPEFWGVSSVTCYDPAYEPYSELPKQKFDAVICTDVLEHCTEEDVPWILDEIFGHANKFVFASVACYEAKKTLSNGENAHCTIKDVEWWSQYLQAMLVRYPHVRFVFDFTQPNMEHFVVKG